MGFEKQSTQMGNFKAKLGPNVVDVSIAGRHCINIPDAKVYSTTAG